MSQNRIKEIAKQKKELNEEQKGLRAEANKNKGARVDATKAKALSRKEIKSLKSDLREETSSISSVLSEGKVDKINALADSITEASAELVGAVRSFGEAVEKLEEL